MERSDSSTEIVNESNTLDVTVDLGGGGLAEGMASGGSSGGSKKKLLAFGAETEDG